MPFQTLTELYFDNKVQVIPSGAISFFSYLDQLEQQINTPGLINLDDSDILTIIAGAERITIFGIEQTGEDKINKVCKKIRDSLPEELAKKAAGAFFHVIGDPEITLYDVNEVAETIFNYLNADAEIIFGAAVDQAADGSIKVLLLLAE